MNHTISRRSLLRGTCATVAGGMAAMAAGANVQSNAAAAAETAPGEPPFRYCLNTSTIRGQGLSLMEEIDLAARAGYDGIEPWIREIDQHAADGRSLEDLRKRIADAGLRVESAIGFAAWIVDDEAKRQEGLEEAKRSMGLVRQIGGSRMAAPPVGATDISGFDLFKAAERYRALLELGRTIGVVPQLEIWGFSKTLSRLGEAVLVAVESGHPDACLLPDVYHIFKGGSDFTGLRLLGAAAMHVFHVNDYPADPPRESINDAARVYPGDGVAPLADILRGLRASGFRGALSLELFNRDYWQQDAAQVARTGLEKMQAAVAESLEENTG